MRPRDQLQEHVIYPFILSKGLHYRRDLKVVPPVVLRLIISAVKGIRNSEGGTTVTMHMVVPLALKATRQQTCDGCKISIEGTKSNYSAGSIKEITELYNRK